MAQGKLTIISEEKQREIEVLASKFCTVREIINCLDLKIKDETFQHHYGEIYQKGREQGKKKLRLLQLEVAEKGNVTMLIWLGKQWLGQREPEKVEPEQDSNSLTININPASERNKLDN